MKILPKADNHVVVELDMHTYDMRRQLDIREGALSGTRFIDVMNGDEKGDIVIMFRDEQNQLHHLRVHAVQIQVSDKQ